MIRHYWYIAGWLVTVAYLLLGMIATQILLATTSGVAAGVSGVSTAVCAVGGGHALFDLRRAGWWR